MTTYCVYTGKCPRRDNIGIIVKNLPPDQSRSHNSIDENTHLLWKTTVTGLYYVSGRTGDRKPKQR